MCAPIQRFMREVAQPFAVATWEQSEALVSNFQGGVLWLDKKINDVTNSFLPTTLAKVVAAFLKCLPFLALSLTCPHPIFWIGLGTIAVYKLCTTPQGKPVEAQNVENGMAFGSLWRAVSGLLTGNIVWGVANLAFSIILLLQTEFISDLCGIESKPAAEDPTKKGAQPPLADQPAQNPQQKGNPDCPTSTST